MSIPAPPQRFRGDICVSGWFTENSGARDGSCLDSSGTVRESLAQTSPARSGGTRRDHARGLHRLTRMGLFVHEQSGPEDRLSETPTVLQVHSLPSWKDFSFGGLLGHHSVPVPLPTPGSAHPFPVPAHCQAVSSSDQPPDFGFRRKESLPPLCWDLL